MTDYVDSDTVLELLREHPDGLTAREIADSLDTSYTAAQNAVRQCYMDGDADLKLPTELTQDKRFVVA